MDIVWWLICTYRSWASPCIIKHNDVWGCSSVGVLVWAWKATEHQQAELRSRREKREEWHARGTLLCAWDFKGMKQIMSLITALRTGLSSLLKLLYLMNHSPSCISWTTLPTAIVHQPVPLYQRSTAHRPASASFPSLFPYSLLLTLSFPVILNKITPFS